MGNNIIIETEQDRILAKFNKMISYFGPHVSGIAMISYWEISDNSPVDSDPTRIKTVTIRGRKVRAFTCENGMGARINHQIKKFNLERVCNWNREIRKLNTISNMYRSIMFLKRQLSSRDSLDKMIRHNCSFCGLSEHNTGKSIKGFRASICLKCVKLYNAENE